MMRSLLYVGAIALLCGTMATAAPVGLITVDEYGHGLPSKVGADPTGGLPGFPVLTYTLPFPGLPGDVLFIDTMEGGAILDVVRFTGQGQMVFYSDNIDGFESLADTPGAPGGIPFAGNEARVEEVGVEGSNWAVYNPQPGQPGFDPALLGVAGINSYVFISDGTAVPLPGAAAMGLALMAGLLIYRRAHKAKPI